MKTMHRSWRLFPLTVCLAAPCSGAIAFSQSQAPASSELPAFEVASIKRNYLPDMMQRARTTTSPGRFTSTNSSLHDLVRAAYGTLVEAQIVGGPEWIRSTKFDINATTAGAPRDRVRLMLRRLLTERFGLAVRLEDRSMPVYRLLKARQDGRLGPSLTPTVCPGPGTANAPRECGVEFLGANSFRGKGITTAQIARSMVTGQEITGVNRVVLDETALGALYDFEVRFTPPTEPFGLRVEKNPDWPAFTTALEEQLGLKLEPGTAPVPVVVIQRANLPTAD